MTSNYNLYTVQRSNETLSEIVFNFYKDEIDYLEEVLLLNVELYKEDVYLTKGLTIKLPLISKTTTKQRVSLWD